MITPRYYQQDSTDAIFNYFFVKKGNPIAVLPTGSGKSLVQAMIVKKLLEDYPGQRVLLATHQQELISQNFDEITKYIPLVDIGIYSAGLNRRDTHNQVICGGIQSIYTKANELGAFTIMIVDECHLIPHKDNGMYRQFIADLLKLNPRMKIIGLSATPYRLDSGLLTEGKNKIFTDICYEISVKELIDNGFLCPLSSPSKALIHADTSKVHIRGGDFIESELFEACNNDEVIKGAVAEICKYSANRNKLLLFCPGIDHAIKTAKIMTESGIPCGVIHSKQSKKENKKILDEYRSGKLKALANVDVLTTGFNDKAIDLIALLRPTMSVGLYYQMVGRGLRLHESKNDCLILDFAENIKRHGPIDKIEIKKTNGEKSEISKAPMKECPNCHELCHLSVKDCPECGYVFISEEKPKHNTEASDLGVISTWKPPFEVEVKDVYYAEHNKNGQKSLKVTYAANFYEKYSEWICIEHSGYAREKARRWWIDRTQEEAPLLVEEALMQTEKIKKPLKIVVDNNSKYPKITQYIF